MGINLVANAIHNASKIRIGKRSCWQQQQFIVFLEFYRVFWLKNYKSDRSTMLKKLSNCEVKAWLCCNLIILLPLSFYVKSNFGKFKQSKNVIFGNFRDSELWLYVNLGFESSSHLLKLKFRTSENVKNDIFGPSEFTKIWFHVKSEWR